MSKGDLQPLVAGGGDRARRKSSSVPSSRGGPHPCRPRESRWHRGGGPHTGPARPSAKLFPAPFAVRGADGMDRRKIQDVEAEVRHIVELVDDILRSVPWDGRVRPASGGKSSYQAEKAAPLAVDPERGAGARPGVSVPPGPGDGHEGRGVGGEGASRASPAPGGALKAPSGRRTGRLGGFGAASMMLRASSSSTEMSWAGVALFRGVAAPGAPDVGQPRMVRWEGPVSGKATSAVQRSLRPLWPAIGRAPIPSAVLEQPRR